MANGRCEHHQTVLRAEHFCEREQGHAGDHLFGFTAGQLSAVLYELQHPSTRPAFPAEAVLLGAGAVGVVMFPHSRSFADWALSLWMMAVAIRWVSRWLTERKG